MTRKDYVLIAGVIRAGFGVEGPALRNIACKFADALAANNASFNRQKFMLACLGKNMYTTITDGTNGAAS